MAGFGDLLKDINSGAAVAPGPMVKPRQQAAKKQKVSDKAADGKPGSKLSNLRGSAGAVNVDVVKVEVKKTQAAQKRDVTPEAVPIKFRLKNVLEYLRNNRKAYTVEELARLSKEKLGDDMLKELNGHSQVVLYDGRYQYNPKVANINNRQQLLNYLRAHTAVDSTYSGGMHGIRILDIDDAYPGVADDITVLQREGSIHVFQHTNPQEAVIFSRNDLGIHVRPEVESLFHDIQIPLDEQGLQAAVEQAGIRSQLGMRPPKARAAGDKKGKKARKQREQKINIGKATNAHLPELFVGAQPQNIDNK